MIVQLLPFCSAEYIVAISTRELTKLEELGRAILNGPPDASTLSEVLGEHVSLMFPYSQLEIRVFPDETLLRHPDDRQPVAASAWEWIAMQSAPVQQDKEDELAEQPQADEAVAGHWQLRAAGADEPAPASPSGVTWTRRRRP